MKYAKFVELVKRNRLIDNWELTFKTGKLRTDKKYIQKFEHLKDFKTYKTIKDLQNMTRLSIFNPSHDGKIRTSWNMFGTETGRCSRLHQEIYLAVLNGNDHLLNQYGVIV